jgi:putative oxidoreductase
VTADPAGRARRAFTILRAISALMLVTHGVARLVAGGVVPFGQWLGSKGFPAGVAIAGAITAVEIAGGLTLAAGFLVAPLALWFAFQLLAGILLVHLPEGWFVVGLGRNGMEYSVLLIVCLLLVAYTGRKSAVAGGEPS